MTAPDNSQNQSTPAPLTNKSEQEHDQQWINTLTNALDEANDNLDLSTSYALQRARKTALAQRKAKSKPSNSIKPGWMVGAVAASALSLIVVFNLGKQSTPAVEPSIETGFQSSDFELLTQNDFLLTDEDLEFYAWLESESEFAG